MARRPEVIKRTDVLTRGGLIDFQAKLAKMNESTLRTYYRAVHSECRLERENDIPTARSVQELVQVWKQLRKGMPRG
jgi:hypothetical protein